MMDEQAYDYPLEKLKSLWVTKIRAAEKHKQECFGDTAEECMAFFDDAYEIMFSDMAERKVSGLAPDKDVTRPAPTFGVVVNKVAEFVRIFGPVLYQRNPVRTVTPRKIPQIDLGPLELAPFLMQQQPQPGLPPTPFGLPGMDPMALAQQQAMLAQQQRQAEVDTSQAIDRIRAQFMELVLNWTPQEFNLKAESRQSIDEALIKGCGALWTELETTIDGTVKIVGSFYETIDSLLIDPDATSLEEAKWIAKKCVHPIWQVEEEYGLTPGTLTGRGHLASSASIAENQQDEDGSLKKARGETNDLLCYWKIWTKMGVGDRLKGAEPGLQGMFDQFGRFSYLVVSDKIPFFLNLPPELLNAPLNEQTSAMISEAIAWPTPCWGMLGKEWPVKLLEFHRVPGQLWPQAPIKPALGELKAIQWIMSFLVGKIHVTCRDFIVLPKATNDEIKDKITSGADLELLEIEQSHPGTIDKLVYFLQHPTINGDVWRVLESLMEMFDKRVGMTELMYGQSGRQLRSASEAQLKGDYLTVRPDDMSDRVEDWASEVCEAEAFAIRWHLMGQDVARVIGKPYVPLWDQFVASAPIEAIANDLEYRIEAGTARKPNKDKDIAVIDESAGYIFGPMVQYMMATGDVTQVNAWVSQWCKSRDIDPEPFMLMPPPPPPPPVVAPPAEGKAKEDKAPPEEPPQAPSDPQPTVGAPPPPMPLTDPLLTAQLATQKPLFLPGPGDLLPLLQGLPQ